MALHHEPRQKPGNRAYFSAQTKANLRSIKTEQPGEKKNNQSALEQQRDTNVENKLFP